MPECVEEEEEREEQIGIDKFYLRLEHVGVCMEEEANFVCIRNVVLIRGMGFGKLFVNHG